MLILSLIAVPLVAAAIGYALGYAAIHFKVEGDPLAEQIAGMLPNGQCGQCGYPGCAQAAKALAKGEALPTLCPPGGESLARKLAALLGVDLGSAGQLGPQVARIDTARCDGCGRCLKQCSYDAIVGATRQLHGVVPDACTGCSACLSVCPQQGISLIPDPLLSVSCHKPDYQPTPSRGTQHA